MLITVFTFLMVRKDVYAFPIAKSVLTLDCAVLFNPAHFFGLLFFRRFVAHSMLKLIVISHMTQVDVKPSKRRGGFAFGCLSPPN